MGLVREKTLLGNVGMDDVTIQKEKYKSIRQEKDTK